MSNIQIIPINKKCQDMILSSGQRLQLVIETMFNVKIYDDRICVINMKFHPLTSLNNPELSPRYKMISSAIETELIHGSHQDISKIAMDFFCVYTGGSIQNALA